MEPIREKRLQSLRDRYLELVKKCLRIQRTGDIKAYTAVAIQAEDIATEIQVLSRKRPLI